MAETLHLQEDSVPSLDDVGRDVQEIPTIEVTPDIEENATEECQQQERQPQGRSELISPKKNKKMKFGKVLKGKIKVPKSKGKRKKAGGIESESVADDLVIESSKVINEEDTSEIDGKSGAPNDKLLPEEGDSEEEKNIPEDIPGKPKKSKTMLKSKFSLLSNKLKGKSKGKQKAADRNTLIEEVKEEEKKEGQEDKEEQEDKAENTKEFDKAKPSGAGTELEQQTPGTELEQQMPESPPASVPESARETRRQARQKLLEKMEIEGKLKATNDDPTVGVGLPTDDVKKRTKRRKRDLPIRDNDAPPTPSPTPQEEETPRQKKRRRKKKMMETADNEVDGGVLSDKTDDVVICNKAVTPSPNTPAPISSTKSSTMRKCTPNKRSKGGPSPDIPSPDIPSPAPDPVLTVLSSPAIRKLESAMSIKLHYAEHLYPTLYLLHPLVKVHLLDSKTGRPLSSTLGDARYSTIQPLLTEPFDLRLHKTMSPCWEELLLVPEPYESITNKETAMLFFEIVDIVPARALKKHKSGWNHIAWAFLKVKSGQGGHNVNRKLRLQLYRYPLVTQTVSDLFLGTSRTKYPSTLYVTVGHVTDRATLSSLYVDQVSALNPALSQYIEHVVQDTAPNNQDELKENKPTWSRAPGQMCKIPKTEYFEIPTPELGCLLMSFSLDGRRLACGCVGKTSNPILVYSVPEGAHLYTLTGHLNIIYDLKWHKTALLSASSDCTARVWRNGKQEKQMSHPSFVYTAQWIDKKQIITGSYDRVIRIWDTNCSGDKCCLLARLQDHTGHINSIVFKGNDTFYSGDSKGQIIEWNGGGSAWSLSESIQPPELKDVPISMLLLHPNKRRMFVQSRDSHVRLVDLRIRAITQRYTGHTNLREHIKCSVSPCGTYLLSASEDGNVYVWLVETGEVCYTYKTGLHHSSSDVKFHPHDNFVAIAAFGSAVPVVLHQRQDTLQDILPGSGVKMDSIKEKLLTVSPSRCETRNKLKLPSTTSGLAQSTPLNSGLTLTQISRDNFLKLRVLNDYAAQRSDEIELRRGEYVNLIYIDTDGWWVGESSTGVQGYFPANHVEQPTPLQSTTFKSVNQTLGTPRSKRRIDFNMSLTNGEKEWQTFDSTATTMHVSRSPRLSDNESVASSSLSASRRRRTLG